MTRFVELSHTIEHGLTTYPGLPPPVISTYMSREASRPHYGEGVEFDIGRIEMVANTGTYLDTPFHRYVDGSDLSDLGLQSVADLPGVVVRPDVADSPGVRPSLWEGMDLQGVALLVETGWSRHWGTEAYSGEGAPFLTAEGVRSLVEAAPALVGIDSLNIDSRKDPERPAHSSLLAAGIPIVEHLTGLHRLPDRGFRFFAVPPRVAGLGSFPVRAFAILP